MTTLVRRMLTVLVPAALVLLLASPAWPTAQIPERIVYEGTEGFLFTDPLETLFHQRQSPPGIRRAPHGLLAGLRRHMGDQGGHPVPLGHQGMDEKRGRQGRPRRVREGLPRKVKTPEGRVVHGNPAHPPGQADPIRPHGLPDRFTSTMCSCVSRRERSSTGRWSTTGTRCHQSPGTVQSGSVRTSR